MFYKPTITALIYSTVITFIFCCIIIILLFQIYCKSVGFSIKLNFSFFYLLFIYICTSRLENGVKKHKERRCSAVLSHFCILFYLTLDFIFTTRLLLLLLRYNNAYICHSIQKWLCILSGALLFEHNCSKRSKNRQWNFYLSFSL